MKKIFKKLAVTALLAGMAALLCSCTEADWNELSELGRQMESQVSAGDMESINRYVSEIGKNDDGDIQYVLYLGTNDKDTNEPVCSREEAKEKAKKILIENLGGYTIQEAEGGWIGDDGVIYQEYTLVIYLSDTTEEDVHKVADQLVEEFNQSSVMIQTNRTKTEFYP